MGALARSYLNSRTTQEAAREYQDMQSDNRPAEAAVDLKRAMAGGVAIAVVVGLGLWAIATQRSEISTAQAAAPAQSALPANGPIPGSRVAPAPQPITLDLDDPASQNVASAEPEVVIEPVREPPHRLAQADLPLHGLPEPVRHRRAESRHNTSHETENVDEATVHNEATDSADSAQTDVNVEPDSPRRTDSAPVVRERDYPRPVPVVTRAPVTPRQQLKQTRPERRQEAAANVAHSSPDRALAVRRDQQARPRKAGGDSMSDWHHRFLDDP